MINSFRTRLIVLFAGLAGGVLLVSLLAVWIATNNQLNRTVERELTVSQRVFLELLEQRATQLGQAASVLADDFGFRQAVATNDEDTIVSALVNHGERIQTDLMVLQNVAGEEIASTHDMSDLPVLSELISMGNEQGISIVNQQLFQLITVPVRAPDLIAWVTLGFSVDDELTAELQALANADVTFYSTDTNSLFVSSLSPAQQQEFQSALSERQQNLSEWLANQHLAGQKVSLANLGEASLSVLLSTDLDAAGAEFSRLRQQYLLIAILTLMVAMLLAVVTARKINAPLKTLTQAAEQLQRGDYTSPIEVNRKDEFGHLAHTFNEMKVAVAEREQRISFQADHDLLTELPNRRYFQRWLAQLLDNQQSGFLVLLNINRFRELNDSVGQRIGDQLLQLISRRLRGWKSSDWFLARLAGDEFLLVNTALEQAPVQNQLEALLALLEQPWSLDGTSYLLRFSAGMVSFPEHGAETDSLVRRAQISRVKAKEEKRSLVVYEAGMDEVHMRQLRILRCLPEAVEKGQLELHYQPKMNCTTGKVKGAEALIRWHHPDLGFVRPDEFIPLAEQAGEITRITRWVCLQVIQQLLVWQQAGKQLSVSLNLSAVDLMSDGLADFLSQAVAGSGIEPHLLTLEVTESAIMQDPEAAIARLQRLQSVGLRISIDDYGTGYSSLAQLKRLPVNELKIDRSFIQHLAESEQDRMIVRSTLALAHDFGLQAVAEGIEEESAWAILKEFGCDELQGYFFSKPLPVAAFTQWLLTQEEVTSS